MAKKHSLFFRFIGALVLVLMIQWQELSSYDLTILGHVKYRESLARIPISLTGLLKDSLTINFIPTPGPYDFRDVPSDIAEILRNPDKTPGNVALLFDELWRLEAVPADYVPKESLIKIAYSMIEGTAIPERWVQLLNKKFDLVLVPDDYYVGVYQNCGVHIPIFSLPHGIDLEEFLNEPVRKKASKPFVFGSSGLFIKRKNQKLLVEAFHREFGNDPSVQLKIHGRDSWDFECEMKAIREIINGLPPSDCVPVQPKSGGVSKGTQRLTPNIEIIHASFSKKQYKKFLKSLDCYVLLSKGEGFSLTPREALALGKPCIISDNTAHRTLGKTGYVYAVPSQIQEPSLQSGMGGYIGFDFNCLVSDVQKALREVYNNYQLYVQKAQEGRIWVEQYLWKNRKAKFLNVIKPKEVILGDENKLTDDFLMTTSKKLYAKYKKLIKN